MNQTDTPQVNYYPISIAVAQTASDPQTNTGAVAVSNSNVVSAPSGTILNGGTLTSPNFSAGNAGWRLDSNGNIEANDGNFRGDITGASGTFSGTVNVGSLNIPDTTTTNSAHIDTTGNLWLGANVANKATAPVRLYNTGAATFTNITATGTINADAGYLASGTYLGATDALAVEATGINVGVTGHIRGGQTDYVSGTGFFLGYSGAAYKFSIGSTTQYLTWDGTSLTILGNTDNVKAAGTYVLASGLTEVQVNQTNYFKVREFYIRDSGTITVDFDLALTDPGNGGGTAYGRIYKNGSAVGTERTKNNSTYATYSENIAVARGDLIQVYVHYTGGVDIVRIRNVYIKANKYEVTTRLDGYGA